MGGWGWGWGRGGADEVGKIILKLRPFTLQYKKINQRYTIWLYQL
jgi:hypothetical protein